MRICQVTSILPYQEHFRGVQAGGRYPLGGIAQYVHSVASRMTQMGHQVTVIATKAPEHGHLTEVELKNGDVRRVSPLVPVYTGCLPLGLLRVLKPSAYDVIHVHTPMPAMAELAALRSIVARIPFILTYHNDVMGSGSLGQFLSRTYRWTLSPLLLHRADLIITTTQSYASSSPSLAPYQHKVRVVPCMVDGERFRPGLDGTRIRLKHRLGPQEAMALFVGGLYPYKGVDYLIRAMAQVVPRVPQARLVIVGKGPCESSWKGIAREQGVEGRVIFAGFVPDEELPGYYAACDVFVLPSVSSEEGFGIVQLEALACGKPVVTTTLPGVREVDAKGVATTHVPPRDAGALSTALVNLLQDKSLAANLGQRGRELCEEKYTVGKVTESLLTLYAQAIQSKGTRG